MGDPLFVVYTEDDKRIGSNPRFYNFEAKKAAKRPPLRSNRPRWGSGSHVIDSDDTFPVEASIALKITHKIPQELWPTIVEQNKVKTYRELAENYNVFYEAIRRVLNAASVKKVKI